MSIPSQIIEVDHIDARACSIVKVQGRYFAIAARLGHEGDMRNAAEMLKEAIASAMREVAAGMVR